MDSQLERLHSAIDTAIRGMTAEQLDRHPAGRWSTAEVLEHLYLSYTGTVKGFERCLESGKPLASSPTLKHRLMTAVVTGVGYLPSGRKAPKQTQPKGTPTEKVVEDIGPQISRMDELIAKCEARHGERTRLLDHPILGPLTARQWRKFHWVHGRHHMKQIQRLQEMP
jgi:hypothetical protein